MTRYIMDMSFVRTYYDDFKDRYPHKKLLGTYYNFVDLLASKDNDLGNIDGRLEFLKNQVLPRLRNEEIIISEPYYEIIRDQYNDIKIGRTLYDRIYRDFLPYLDQIATYGKNIDDDLKASIIDYTEDQQRRKLKQIKDFQHFSNLFSQQIVGEGGNVGNIDRWEEKVANYLRNRIYKYATEGNYLPSNFIIDMEKISLDSCELFIKTVALYLQNTNHDLTPSLNDNIDILTLLYVRNERKLLMRDKRWTDLITRSGLAEKYLHPLA